MSTDEPVDIDYTGTAWIQTINKQQLIGCLTHLELEFDANSGIDALRKILRKHIRRVNKEDKDNKTKTVHIMAEHNSSSPKLKFILGKDDWEIYTERLELYFLANDVKNEKKVPILLTKINPETYKLARDLCAPKKSGEKTYDQLSLLKTT